MTVYEVPLSPGVPQSFLIELGANQYRLTLRWCEPLGVWLLDIATAAGAAVIMGTPLVTGVNLLAQLGYLGLPGQLRAQTFGDIDTPPGFDNLGTDGLLFFVTP